MIANDFDEAKKSVLSFCSSAQTSLGALLIGYSVTLFAFFELTKEFEISRLSNSFDLGLEIPYIDLIVENHWVKLGLLFLGALLLTTLIIRTIHRYGAYSGISNQILYMIKSEKSENESIHNAILRNSYEIMKEQKRRAFLLPFNWFVTGEELKGTGKRNDRETFFGWVVSFGIAVILVLGLFVLLW